MTTRGIKPVGYFDCPGGGQVVVSGDVAYIAHIKPPHGTTIVDVSDPARPRKLAELTVPHDVHSHKVTRPDRPREITFWECRGSNDVCFDSRGLLYLIDRNRGLHILERI